MYGNCCMFVPLSKGCLQSGIIAVCQNTLCNCHAMSCSTVYENNKHINFCCNSIKGIGTLVEKIIQSVDLFFPVQLIVSLIVYQHVNYFFLSIFRSPFMLRGDI